MVLVNGEVKWSLVRLVCGYQSLEHDFCILSDNPLELLGRTSLRLLTLHVKDWLQWEEDLSASTSIIKKGQKWHTLSSSP